MRKQVPKPVPGAGAEMRQAGIDAGLYDHGDSYYTNVVRGKPHELALVIPGASPDAVERGLAAARAVFEQAGIDPRFAEKSNWAELESSNATAGQRSSDKADAAAAFRLAEAVALDTALGPHVNRPGGSKLFVKVIV